MDAASADAYDTVAPVARLAVRDGLARSVFRARTTGTTLGVHAGRAQTLQCIHPRCRSDNDLPQREKRELSDACRTALAATTSTRSSAAATILFFSSTENGLGSIIGPWSARLRVKTTVSDQSQTRLSTCSRATVTSSFTTRSGTVLKSSAILAFSFSIFVAVSFAITSLRFG